MFLEADWSMLVNKRQAANGSDKLCVCCQIEAQVLAYDGCPCLSQMHLCSKEQLQLADESRVIQASLMSKREVLKQ